MKVFSIWRCAGSAGVRLSVENGKNVNERHWRYSLWSGRQVSVPKEAADFLEQDGKREQAQEKRDQGHLSKSAFETVLFGSECVRHPAEDAVFRNLQLETLRKAVDGLGDQGWNLVELQYGRSLTMEKIGRIYGVSKAAKKVPRTDGHRPAAEGVPGAQVGRP